MTATATRITPFDATTRPVRYAADRRPVYFIQALSGGPVKIGVGDDPNRRLVALQPGNPHQLAIIGVIPNGGQARERDLHLQFRAARMSGEWFEPVPELLAYIREASVSYRTPARMERSTLGIKVDGPHLRVLRKRTGESVSTVAGRAQISVQYLSQIERGQREPLRAVFDRICEALQVTEQERDELLREAS